MTNRWYCSAHGEECSRKDCVFRYDEEGINDEYKWTGNSWPPLDCWIAGDGTKVYRSYAEYVDG